MAGITIEHLCKCYPNGVKAVDDVNIQMDDGEFVVLLGPSGCGKSTILMMLAGLEDVTEGEIYFGDVCVNGLKPKERDMGLVFQSYALLPNMTVYENIGFGLTIRKVDKKEKDQKIREAAKILGLTELLDRKPKQLSGGQKQRVAIGRCIVRDPKVFLFDEPLSNLDAKLRVQMRKELIKLHRMLGTTIVYVTHDQIEAMTMASKIMVMKGGRVQQVGSPQEVYKRPANRYVATFVGSPRMNILTSAFRGEGRRGRLFLKNGQELFLSDSQAEKIPGCLKDGDSVYVGIRPERINVGPEYQTFSAEVKFTEMMGSESFIYMKFDDEDINARTGISDAVCGQPIGFSVDTKDMVLFDFETEERIRLEEM